jgi:hypothetical protein
MTGASAPLSYLVDNIYLEYYLRNNQFLDLRSFEIILSKESFVNTSPDPFAAAKIFQNPKKVFLLIKVALACSTNFFTIIIFKFLPFSLSQLW